MAQRRPVGQLFSNNVTSGNSRVHFGNVIHAHYDYENIWRWLDAPDVQSAHEESQRKHKPNTGTWLLESDIYHNWKAGQTQHLWLHGKAGSGKTVLCSTVVTDLQTTTIIPGNLAFFYFSFADATRQSYDGLLRSLVSQFARSDSRRQILETAKERTGLSQPSRDVLEDILAEILSGPTPVYVCIDALDECPEDELRDDLFESIGTLLSKVPNVKLFMTSRRLSDIEEELRSFVVSKLSIHDGEANKDILRYVTDELHSHRNLRRLNPATKDLVVKVFAEKANGMFRWAFCQMQSLKRLKALSIDSNVRNTLAALPQDLDETYARMLRRISLMGSLEQRIALTALQWLVTAREALTLHLLVQACTMSTNEDLTQLQDKDVLEILGDLVSITYSHAPPDSDPKVVQTMRRLQSRFTNQTKPKIELAHFTVQEYLLSGRVAPEIAHLGLREAEAHKTVAGICCAALSNDEYPGKRELVSPRVDDSVGDDIDRCCPLLVYAQQYWHTHSSLHQSTDVEAEVRLVSSWIARRRIELIDGGVQEPFNAETLFASMPPLHYAATLGLEKVVDRLCELGADVTAQNGHGGTSMHYACHSHHDAVVMVLLSKGVPKSAQDIEYKIMLERLIKDRDSTAVGQLLRLGANPAVVYEYVQIQCQADHNESAIDYSTSQLAIWEATSSVGYFLEDSEQVFNISSD